MKFKLALIAAVLSAGTESSVIMRAFIPFLICMLICIALVTLPPRIATRRPALVMGKKR